MKKILLFLVVSALFTCTFLQAGPIELSEEEKEWLKAHQEIVVGAEMDWPPYDYVVNGKVMGFANGHIRLLAKKLGINLRFVHGYNWSELIEKIKKKEIDVLPIIYKNAEREPFITFTSPYFKTTNVLVVHEDETQIRDLSDLSGKEVAVVKGYAAEAIIKEVNPDILIHPVSTPVDGLLSVSEGHADAYLDYLGTVNYLRREHLIQGLKIVNTNVLPVIEGEGLGIGVRKDWEILAEILTKANASVSPKEHRRLRDTWFLGGGHYPSEFVLTEQEKSWLKSLGKLSIGIDTSWVPIKFIGEDGLHQGISSEYVRIIEEKTGLDFEVVADAWQEIQSRTKSGEIDILPILNKTKSRESYLKFTKPYVRIPMVIATHIETEYIADINDLGDSIVGVGEGFAIQDRLKQDYPDLKILGFKTIEEAVIALEAKEISALVVNSAVFTYLQNKLGVKKSTRINNSTPYWDNLSIGIRHEFAPLVPILNKVLGSITPQEHKLILEKWANLPVQIRTDWGTLGYLLAILTTIILFISFWSLRLSKEVKRRRKAEIELIESDQRFQSVFSKTTDLVLVWDKNHRVVYANQSALEYFDLNKESVYGKPILESINEEPEFRKLWKQRLTAAFESGETRSFEDRTRLFGRETYSESTISPLFSDAGGMYAVTLVYRDVTVQKMFETTLIQNEERLRNLFENTPFAYQSLDREGRILDVNTEWEKLLGFQKEEVAGLSFETLCVDSDESWFSKWFESFKRDGFTRQDLQLTRKKGEVRQVILNGSIQYDEQGGIICGHSILHDITEHKDLERSLLTAKEAAEAASLAKSEFLANMGHELRTPLNAITGFSELLYSLVTDSTQKTYLEAIKTSGRNLLLLINDILDLSKIEAGKLEIKHDPIRLNSIFNEVAQIFGQELDQKKLSFLIESPNDRSEILYLDETRIRQILLNLVGNAVKFTETGFVKLSFKISNVSGGKADVFLSVQDSGIGIPEENQVKIFEFFEQQPDQPVHYGGTGLGLAITKRLVEKMNGEIYLESEPEKGSTFSIRLKDVRIDLPNGDVISEQAPEFKQISFSSETVLVIDDIESNRNLLKEFLSRVNLTPLTIDNARDGIKIAEEKQPDVIIMDLKMPGMDGMEATRLLKASSITGKIPVVALTAASGIGERAKVDTQLFDGYLLKPVRLGELTKELKRHLAVCSGEDFGPEMEATRSDAFILPSLDLAGFIGKMEEEVLPTLKAQKKALVIDDLILFLQRLEEIGEQHRASDLLSKADELKQMAEQLDLRGLQEKLEQLPEQIELSINQLKTHGEITEN